MNLLILGGTVFLGRHLTVAALEAGHQVTHFNRGKSNTGLFPDVPTLTGDRDGDLSALEGRTWDAVIDTCGYVPRLVGDSAKALADSVAHYTFISSVSVYPEFGEANPEDAPLASLDDESVEEVTGETYGGLKAACERAADAAMPGRALHVRAGLIVGPDDPTDRFTYWPVRMNRGGDVIAPGRPEATVQFIDVRDLSKWILHAIDHELTGPFNVTGPTTPLTMESFLATCRDTVGSESTLRWIDDATLATHEVQPWMQLPLWIPDTDMITDCSKANENRLWTRPLADTLRDTLGWALARPTEGTFKHALTADREAEILAAIGSS